MNDDISLPRLPAALRQLTGVEPPAYQALWNLAVACKFPVSFVNNRYHVRRADLPAIAAVLGMKPKALRKPQHARAA